MNALNIKKQKVNIMKNTISIFGIIMMMGSFMSGNANASIEKPGGTVYNPLDDSIECRDEVYCNDNYITGELESILGWDSMNFSRGTIVK